MVLYDQEEPGFLGFSWRTYASTFRWSFGVSSWDEALTICSNLNFRAAVQVWGHGRSGYPVIAGRPAPWRHEGYANLDSIWFRSCSVANGLVGLAFCETVARQCSVVAHLGVIGTWGVQSRLVGCRLGDRPWWGLDHGVRPDERSAPWLPRTVPASARSLPSWAFTPGMRPR